MYDLCNFIYKSSCITLSVDEVESFSFQKIWCFLFFFFLYNYWLSFSLFMLAFLFLVSFPSHILIFLSWMTFPYLSLFLHSFSFSPGFVFLSFLSLCFSFLSFSVIYSLFLTLPISLLLYTLSTQHLFICLP